MRTIDIELELMRILDKIEMKSYENFKREVLKEIFIKFLQNATNEKEKKYILTIIDNINWYWTKSMYQRMILVVQKEYVHI